MEWKEVLEFLYSSQVLFDFIIFISLKLTYFLYLLPVDSSRTHHHNSHLQFTFTCIKFLITFILSTICSGVGYYIIFFLPRRLYFISSGALYSHSITIIIHFLPKLGSSRLFRITCWVMYFPGISFPVLGFRVPPIYNVAAAAVNRHPLYLDPTIIIIIISQCLPRAIY